MDQLLRDGTMTLPLEPVKHILSMDVMEIRTILQPNKIARITVELNHVQTAEKCGKSRMERRVPVPPIDNAHQPITVLQSPRGPVPSTRQRVFAVHPKISCALNHVTSESVAHRPESPDGTSTPIRRRARLSNTMDVREIETISLHRSRVRTIVCLKHVLRVLSWQRMETVRGWFNARILEEMDEFLEDVQMDTLVIRRHFWIRTCVVERRLNFNPCAQRPQLHSSRPSPSNQCNVLQTSTAPAQETSSAGSRQRLHQSTPSIVVDLRIRLILDTAHPNLSQYPERTEPNTNTAPHRLHSMTQSRDAEPIDIANFRLIWKDISVVDSSPTSDCRMCVHHSRRIWCLSSWPETIGRAIHTPVPEPHNHAQTTRHASTQETTTDSSVAEFNWDKERSRPRPLFSIFLLYFSSFLSPSHSQNVHVCVFKKNRKNFQKNSTVYGFLSLYQPSLSFSTISKLWKFFEIFLKAGNNFSLEKKQFSTRIAIFSYFVFCSFCFIF